jgi:hypothetical protein
MANECCQRFAGCLIPHQGNTKLLVEVGLPRSNFIVQEFRVPSVADDAIVFSATLPVSRETVFFLARLLHQRRIEVGTRRGTRALGPFKQAVLVLRWFLDATRVSQLAGDNGISRSTAYTRLHEGIEVLAVLAPHVHEALAAVRAAGASHVNLDGTLIDTDRIARKGPNGADRWWSGKHKRHGGNIQVLSYPDGFPAWASGVRSALGRPVAACHGASSAARTTSTSSSSSSSDSRDVRWSRNDPAPQVL